VIDHAPPPSYYAAALILAAALVEACATPRAAEPADRADIPVALAFPAGEEPALRLGARGTQNYECRAGKDGSYGWVLVAPEADLFDSSGKRVGEHYAGPTWESSVDGSKVIATLKAREPAPDRDAIPWLLLTVTQTTGDGLLGQVKSVQRTHTRGGAPPGGACSIGAAVKVPYTAVYWFSRAKP
jgi:hypothetical protein